MKKLLIFGGILGIGYSFYYYFKKQLNLALAFDYQLKGFQVEELTASEANIKLVLEIRNKSSFKIIVNSYDFTFSYEGHPIANTVTDIPIEIKPYSSFLVTIDADIDLKESLSALLPFLKNTLQKKPMVIIANGNVNVTFLGINHTVKLENEQFNYSNNLLADLGLEKPIDNLKNKADNLLGKIGINI